jgi:two-component system LytT family sensor kinase
MISDAALGRLVRTTLIIATVWTVAVIIGTAAHYFGMMDGGTMPMSHIIGDSVAMWYVWIPGTLAIFAVHRQLPFSKTGWPIAVAAHAVVLTGIFAGQVWMSVTIGAMTGHIHMGFVEHAQMLAYDLVAYDAAIYVGVIAVGYGLDMARRYRERDLRASQLEAQLQRSRLEALQAQLQPHFLFNALNSVAMLVRRDRKDEAVNVIVGFSELLRYVLDEAGTIDVPLSEELAFVGRYLDIERIRYGSRLRVCISASPEARRALAPNLVLQPLVENALKHGIARTPAGGEIRIDARRVGQRLRIEVANDGPPLDDGFSLDGADGVGLRNLRERLQVLSGADGTLQIKNSLSGVVAVVEIGYRESGAGAAADEQKRSTAS